MKSALAFAVSLLLAACGSKLNGTYSDELGVTSYKFESGGKVYMSAMGTETELSYTVDGGRIKIQTPQGTLILTLLDDGSLQGPMGTKLSKSSTETRTATASPDRGSSRLDGTYADKMGITSYKFESRGRVYVTVMGTETEAKYTVDGNRVKVENPQGNIILTFLDDGALRGPGGVKLSKRSSQH